jgi:CYTH domain-containing protein
LGIPNVNSRGLTLDKDVFLADLRNGSVSSELEAVEARQLSDLPLLLGRRHVGDIRNV